MEKIIQGLKNLLYGSKTEVEGYILVSDLKTNQSQVLVKEGKNSWRTRWFSNETTNYKTPLTPLSEVFVQRN